ncbi:MAG: tetratricopeptide repeat protein [Anaerolineae bacterium]|nr:tetratricopeptide repeat protein [Anaerolineae bacterium]
MTLWRDVRAWLGLARLRAILGLLVLTGLASLALQTAFPGEGWSLAAQTGLAVAFLAGTLAVLASRMTAPARQRLAIRFGPALAVVLVGVAWPGYFQLFLGAAFGWVLVAGFVMRNPERREYKTAIKAMRGGDYAAAIAAMTELIRKEPEAAQHYDFRARLYRINDDLPRARNDYQAVLRLAPDSGMGQNGLAEISLQAGDLAEARRWGSAAVEQLPNDWVAHYNLGMILERQGDAAAARPVLERALEMGLPASRHRLLARVWLVKVLHRLGEKTAANTLVQSLAQEKSGLREWKTILTSDEAAAMRHLLEPDISLAEALLNGEKLERALRAKR